MYDLPRCGGYQAAGQHFGESFVARAHTQFGDSVAASGAAEAKRWAARREIV